MNHTTKGILQMGIVVALVFLIGLYLRNKPDYDAIALDTPTQLTIKGFDVVDSYPSLKFGSDEKWESYLNSLQDTDFELYQGEGDINGGPVDVKFALTPAGELIGRYHSSNGVTLDLNGYIESETGDLLVHLGHKKYQSDWILSPVAENSTAEEYVYQGVWGAKQVPSTLKITKMN